MLIDLPLPDQTKASWLREAERLSSLGHSPWEVAAALVSLGFPDIAVDLAVAAIKSDIARIDRVERYGLFGKVL